MTVQTRNDEMQSLIRGDTPYPASLVIGRLSADAGAVASFDFQNIPQTFFSLTLRLYARGSAGIPNAGVLVTFNGDGSAIYDCLSYNVRHSGVLATGEALAATSMTVAGIAAGTAPAGTFDYTRIEIPNYANANGHKTVFAAGGNKIGTTTGTLYSVNASGWYRSANAISRVTLTLSAGNFAQYSRCVLIGEY